VEGNACDYCSAFGYSICLTEEQAEQVEPFGAVCDSGRSAEGSKSAGVAEAALEVKQVPDVSCILDTAFGGDESSCEATKDVEGNPCEYCSAFGYSICLTEEQATAVEPFGAVCDSARSAEGSKSAGVEEAALEVKQVPDVSCILNTAAGGDQSSCLSTKDVEGNACDYCSAFGYSFCLTGEQATAVEPFGAVCDSARSAEGGKSAGVAEAALEVKQVPDVTCILNTASGGDQSSCLSTKDVEGNPCDYCSAFGYSICLTEGQAETVEPFGAVCDSARSAEGGKSAGVEEAALIEDAVEEEGMAYEVKN